MILSKAGIILAVAGVRIPTNRLVQHCSGAVFVIRIETFPAALAALRAASARTDTRPCRAEPRQLILDPLLRNLANAAPMAPACCGGRSGR